MTVKMIWGDFLNTLTGFEEIAIKQMTGVSVDDLIGDKRAGIPPQFSLLMRGLAAVAEMREDPKVTLVEGYARAQKLSRVELADFFSPDDDEDETLGADGESVSESGKDEPTPPATPTSSPTSVSEPA